jgi:hypothetical protein
METAMDVGMARSGFLEADNAPAAVPNPFDYLLGMTLLRFPGTYDQKYGSDCPFYRLKETKSAGQNRNPSSCEPLSGASILVPIKRVSSL